MAAIQFTEATKAYPRTIAPAGKYPIVGDRIYRTLQDAQDYVDGKSSSKSAIPGIYLSVIADGTNNGAYWVEQAAGYDGATVGVLRKMGGGITSVSFTLGSDTDNAVSLDINGEEQAISVETLRTSLGLKSFAYEGIDADDLEGVLSEGEGISYTDGEISLAPVYNLNPGDYIGVTVDKYGRVTKGRSAIEIGDVTGLSAKFGDYVLLTDYDEEINRINTKFGDYVLRTDYDKDINDSEAGLAARIAKIEGWFELDDNNNIRTTYNFYSTKQIASGGIGDASGSGLGLLLTEWPTDSEDYSKYALGGNLGIELNTRLTAVEGKATNVTVSPTLSQGKPMGTIMVDGVSQTMYAPATYSADDILPTQERNFVSLQDIEYWNTAYLPKTGGEFKGSLVPDKDGAYHLGSSSYRLGVVFALQGVFYGGLSINHESVATQTWAEERYLKLGGGAIGRNGSNSFPLNIESTSSYTGIAFVTSGGTAWMRYMGGSDWGVTDAGWKNSYTLIHSGNIGSYAFVPRTRIQNDTDANTLLTNGVYLNETGNGSGNNNFPQAYSILMTAAQSSNFVAQISIGNKSMWVRRRLDSWSDWVEVIHSANIGSQSVASATKLADDTAFTVWGQKFFENGKPKSISMNTDLQARILYFRNKNNDNYAGYVGRGDPNADDVILFGRTNLKFYTNSTTRMLINSSGNVTIGGSDLASTTTKLYVDGGIRFAPRTLWGQSFDGTGNVDGSLAITAGNITITKGYQLNFRNTADNTYIESISFRGDSFHIGYGNINKYDTYIQGKNIVLRPGAGAEAMRINSSSNVGIGTTDPQYKLDVNGTVRFNGNIVLASDFTVDATTWYVSFGINGARVTSDVRASWRSTIFGNAGAGSRIKTVRTDVTIDNFSEIYGNGLAWASGDTHGYIGVSYGSKQAFIGGGSSDKLSWTAKLFHNEMTLEPYKDNTHQIGSASKRYTNAYLSNSIRIGSAILSWDSANNALKIEGNVYATGQVAAGGVGTAVATIASDHEDRIAQLEAKVESLMS